MTLQLAEPLNPSETGLVLLLNELLCLLLFEQSLLLDLILSGHIVFIDDHLIKVDAGTT